MNSAPNTQSGWLPLALVSCTWVSVLSTDLYAPSLPHLPELLGTTESAAKLTLSFNLAAFALAQQVHAPLSDRIGRRQLLLIGMIGFGLVSGVCALSPDIITLIVGRTAQGFLSSVPSVVVLLLIHDLYSKQDAVKVLGFHGMAVGVAPIIGPLIGGAVFVALGWRMNFWLLAIFAVLVSLAVWNIVTSTGHTPTRLPFREVFSRYLSVLSKVTVWHNLLPLAATYGILFSFVTAGPFILIDQFAVPTEAYGLYFGAIVAAAILGALTANRLAEKLKIHALRNLAYGAVGTGVLVSFGLALTDTITPLYLTSAMMIFGLGLGLMNATVPLLILSALEPPLKSYGSALSGSSQLVAASGASFAVAMFDDSGVWPMLSVMVGLFVIGFLALCASIKPNNLDI